MVIAYLFKCHDARIDCFGFNFEFLNRLIVSPFFVNKDDGIRNISITYPLAKLKKEHWTNTNSVDKDISF